MAIANAPTQRIISTNTFCRAHFAGVPGLANLVEMCAKRSNLAPESIRVKTVTTTTHA